MTRPTLSALAAILLVSSSALAQGTQLQIGYAHSTPMGGDFRDSSKVVDPGGGIDIAIVGPWKRWIAGVGLQSTKNPVDYDPLDDTEDDLRMVYLYFEMRRQVPAVSIFRPYLAARLGLKSTWNHTELVDDVGARVSGDASQKGPALGVALGVNIPVNRWFGVHAAAGLTLIRLGDVDFEGSNVPNTSITGFATGLRIGGTIDFSRREEQ